MADTASTDFEKPVILQGQRDDGSVVTRAAVTDTVVPDAALIAASAPAPEDRSSRPRLIGEPRIVSLVQPGAPGPSAQPIPNASADDLLRVTGNRVNLRAGPSTSNSVVGSLTRGALAERIGDESNGWVEIRDVLTGKTGYMAARFLEPS